MVDWSHGYDVSVGYTYGYTAETAPGWLDLCTRIAGTEPPRRGPEGQFRYLELGSGQGLGLCLLAAANPQAEFIGVDFHPEHIAHSESLAAQAGLTNIRFVEADFIDLAKAWPADFGTFDYVMLHGIFAWVPPKVREAIVQCLAVATRSGALVYNSYNTQPGWLAGMPFRHISRRLRETSTKPGKEVVEESIALFDKMGAADAALFRAQPGLRQWIDRVKARDSAYLIQEYLNENSSPFWHSDVAKAFLPAKLSYVGPATIAETLMPAELSAAQQEILAGQQDPTMRQDIQDALINQSFRRDIFCRGKRSSVGHDFRGNTRVHLIALPEAGEAVQVATIFGARKFEQAEIAEITDALRTGSKSLNELAAMPGAREKGWRWTLQTVILLLQARVLGLEVAGHGDDAASHRLNAAIAHGSFHGLPYRQVAAPRLGSAISVGVSDLLVLDSWFTLGGKADAAALTSAILARLASVGRKLVHEGKVLEGAELEQNIALKVRGFFEENLERWRRLGILP